MFYLMSYYSKITILARFKCSLNLLTPPADHCPIVLAPLVAAEPLLPMKVLPQTSTKDLSTHYVQGEIRVSARDATTIGSVAWISAVAPRVYENSLVVAVVKILERNGATDLWVLMDVITKFSGVYHTDLVALLRPGCTRKSGQFSAPPCVQLCLGIIPCSGGTRPRVVPSSGLKAASKKRKTGPAGQEPAAKKPKGGSAGDHAPEKSEGDGRPPPTT
ncbi:cd0fb1e4-99ea-4163-adaf-ab4a3adb715f [Sclerotinia trifoliorum]|uniref:Cd0fb1e4-99ea-4163-adaf-ab4a3adb715f n=1 Tax=Sclerotinia trifoliorum TaxID=28548 RepID=A0A8H2W158_9HELO|nr:cd0fb1e4-99ea-4163-adaf-ab4a3adb715f [Sclerotinia trifoliorum]